MHSRRLHANTQIRITACRYVRVVGVAGASKTRMPARGAPQHRARLTLRSHMCAKAVGIPRRGSSVQLPRCSHVPSREGARSEPGQPAQEYYANSDSKGPPGAGPVLAARKGAARATREAAGERRRRRCRATCQPNLQVWMSLLISAMSVADSRAKQVRYHRGQHTHASWAGTHMHVVEPHWGGRTRAAFIYERAWAWSALACWLLATTLYARDRARQYTPCRRGRQEGVVSGALVGEQREGCRDANAHVASLTPPCEHLPCMRHPTPANKSQTPWPQPPSWPLSEHCLPC